MARSSARSVETERILAARRAVYVAAQQSAQHARRKRSRAWSLVRRAAASPWVRRLAVTCAGAAVAALCVQAPEWARPACVAVANTLHAAGLP